MFPCCWYDDTDMFPMCFPKDARIEAEYEQELNTARKLLQTAKDKCFAEQAAIFQNKENIAKAEKEVEQLKKRVQMMEKKMTEIGK